MPESQPPESHEPDDHYLLGMTRAAARRYELFDDLLEPATLPLAHSLGVPRDGRVLEIGCGIGRTAVEFAKRIVPDGQVVAIDESEQLVAYARGKAERAGLRNITFIVARAQDHAYEPESFDLAHTRYVLSFSPFAADIVAKAAAALRPGGRFLGEEVAQHDASHRQPKWHADMVKWFGKMIEATGGQPNYGLIGLPGDMLAAGLVGLRITGFWPLDPQASLVEMLRLVLANEMRQGLIDHGIATAEEIDAAVAAMDDMDGRLITSTPVIQVIGVRPTAPHAPPSPPA